MNMQDVMDKLHKGVNRRFIDRETGLEISQEEAYKQVMATGVMIVQMEVDDGKQERSHCGLDAIEDKQGKEG